MKSTIEKIKAPEITLPALFEDKDAGLVILVTKRNGDYCEGMVVNKCHLPLGYYNRSWFFGELKPFTDKIILENS